MWTTLTDGGFTKQYFFDRRIESDWEIGSVVHYWQPDGTFDVQGKVLSSATCPRRLSVTWRAEWLEEYPYLPEAVVTFQLDPLGDVVRLTMSEFHPEHIEGKYL